MSTHEDHLDALKDIRSIMDRSTRFLSLSGLSGVFTGLFALVGSGIAYYTVNKSPVAIRSGVDDVGRSQLLDINEEVAMFLIMVAMGVLFLSVAVSLYFTRRNAIKNKQEIWNSASRRMLVSLLIPLFTGGVFCLVLLYHGLFALIAPTTLIFYGLALVNAGKYTLGEVTYLGITEIIIGAVASFFLGFGIFFWAFGFGICHIIYGILMYFRYER